MDYEPYYLKMLRELENSASFRIANELDQSPVMRHVREMLDSPIARTIRMLEEQDVAAQALNLHHDSASRLLELQEQSATYRLAKQLGEINVFKEQAELARKASSPFGDLRSIQEMFEQQLNIAESLNASSHFKDLLDRASSLAQQFGVADEVAMGPQTRSHLSDEAIDLARQALADAEAHDDELDVSKPGGMQRLLGFLFVLDMLIRAMTIYSFYFDDDAKRKDLERATEQVIEVCQQKAEKLVQNYVGHVVTAKNGLLIRSGAGRDNPKIGLLPTGTVFWVTESDGDWRAGFYFDDEGERQWGWAYRKNMVRNPDLLEPPTD